MDVDVDKGIWWQIYISERKGKSRILKQEKKEKEKRTRLWAGCESVQSFVWRWNFLLRNIKG